MSPLSDLPQALPTLLRKYRLAAGFRTQQDAADAIDVHVKTVSRWENGTTTPELEAKSLARNS